jgi:small conductance mechanosensitive channel
MIMDSLEVMGVDRFTESGVVIRARIKTLPIQQWAVGREMNRRIKKAFDAAGVEIPFAHTTIAVSSASAPLKVQAEGRDRDELRRIVRELVEEARNDLDGPQSSPGRTGAN